MTGFPDMRITIESGLEQADRVGVRWVVDATHTGPFGDIPPTGKRIHVTGCAVARIQDGQLIEELSNSDVLGLLRQLGVLPGAQKLPPWFFRVSPAEECVVANESPAAPRGVVAGVRSTICSSSLAMCQRTIRTCDGRGPF